MPDWDERARGVCARGYRGAMMGRPHIEGKSLDQLLEALVGTAEVGTAIHEQIKAAISAEIPRLQRDAARDSLRWAKWSILS
jgi:hypothetical protein